MGQWWQNFMDRTQDFFAPLRDIPWGFSRWPTVYEGMLKACPVVGHQTFPDPDCLAVVQSLSVPTYRWWLAPPAPYNGFFPLPPAVRHMFTMYCMPVNWFELCWRFYFKKPKLIHCKYLISATQSITIGRKWRICQYGNFKKHQILQPSNKSRKQYKGKLY